MSWHYQLIRHIWPSGKEWYAIHEKFNLAGGEEMTTQDPITVVGDSEQEVVWTLQRMLEDIKKHGIEERND